MPTEAPWVARAAATESAAPGPDRLVGTYAEVRATLAFQVRPGVLRDRLPEEWQLVAIEGSAGAAVSLVVVEQLALTTAKGESGPVTQVATLSCPVLRDGSNVPITAVLGGFSPSPSYVPGAYGNFELARAFIERVNCIDPSGASHAHELWDYRGDGGDGLILELEYARQPPVRRHRTAMICSAAKPGLYRRYEIDEAVDIVFNRRSAVDRTSHYALKVLGGRLAEILDGSHELISISVSPWYMRQVFIATSPELPS
jgi:hypothetical protein